MTGAAHFLFVISVVRRIGARGNAYFNTVYNTEVGAGDAIVGTDRHTAQALRVTPEIEDVSV